LVGDVIEFGGRHAVDDGVERHARAFIHIEIPGAVHPFPGDDGSVGERGVVQNAWCGNRKPSMDELERANFRVVVPDELD
jgi:hypothetical protein